MHFRMLLMGRIMCLQVKLLRTRQMQYQTNMQMSTPNKIYNLYILEDMKHPYSPPFWVLISLMNLHFLNENHFQILHILKMGGRTHNHFRNVPIFLDGWIIL